MKKKTIILRAVFVIALAISIGVSGLWGYYDAVMGFLKDSKEASISNSDDEDLVYDKDIINILVVGSDRRADESANGRSDSTMIATIDTKNKKVKVTSLMRDMYIDIPGHGMDKFNSSYSYGGVELLADTITKNFDIKLDGYVIVDFSSFKKVINQIGGVTVNVTEKDAAYLNNTGEQDSGFILKKKYRTVKVGKQKLNGDQALAYSRIRKVVHPKYGDGEFGRCLRQQEVLQSLLKEVKSQSLTSVLGIATDMMSEVSTDLDSAHIQSLIKAVMNFKLNKIESLRLPYEGTYIMGRRNGMFVFIINLEANKAKLQNFIFGIGDDNADYSKDFGEITEPASDGSSTSQSYQNETNIYTSTKTATTTTEAKTTEKTTTERPTTERPTTERHTTERTTTERPTTERPTTERPTTERPTTEHTPTEEDAE